MGLAGNPALQASQGLNENSVIPAEEEIDSEEDSTSLHSLTEDDISMLQPGTYLVTAATSNSQSRPATLVLTSTAQKFLVVGAALPQQQLQQNVPNIPSPVNEEEEDAMDADSVLAESLQKTMDKNRESLEIKLLMRRPIEQLVDQGIMPCKITYLYFRECLQS